MSKTYVIADLHGRFDLLVMALAKIANHAELPATLITLGDYVDRGPDSRKIIERLMRGLGHEGWRLICLKGNHEDMLLGVIDSPGDLMWWINNGGETTLTSYGVKRISEIPPEHIAWMKTLPLYHDDGLRFFVNAGVDPTIKLSEQSEHTMLRTRERYPGHTPLRPRVPELHPHWLNLDTGAVFGGPLTAAAFNTEQAGPVAFITDAGDVRHLQKRAW